MLTVIFFHMKAQLIPGGFVGVDIFFVISGYLITKNITQELSAGQFSLIEFYRRRVKRIVPVMLAVICCALLVGYFVLLPEDLVAMAKSAIWSVGSLANVFFWREADTDYFAIASSQLPLLHLWSLGVEEQFYLVWPVMLAIVWRIVPSRAESSSSYCVALALAVVTIPISVALAAYLFAHDARFVYYMLPTRAGELMTGAAVALGVSAYPGLKTSVSSSRTLAWGGLILIGLSLFLLRQTEPFPGWRALPPTAGAALLLIAGLHHTGTGSIRCLSWAPIVWIGKLSYSLYLWHWPVLAYWRYIWGEPTAYACAILLPTIFVLAYLSYELVEQPARRSRSNAARVFFQQFIAPGAIILSGASVLVFGDRLGMATHSRPYLAKLTSWRNEFKPAYQFDWVCQRQLLSVKDLIDERCVLGPSSNQQPQVLLWGDSNAAHYIPMVEVWSQQAGFTFRNFAIGSCPPLLGDPAPFVRPDRRASCAESLEVAWPEVMRYPIVILGASWSGYDQAAPGFMQRLEDTVRRLTENGQQVVLMAKTTVLKGYDGRCSEKSLKMHFLACAQPPQSLAEEVAKVNEELRLLAGRLPGASYFDTNRYLCPENKCPVYGPKGQPLYFDASHLNVPASTELGRRTMAEGNLPEALRSLLH